jgi:23S rRNA (uracil1939-C5)-methyltransferase
LRNSITSLKKGKEYELTITDLAFGGKGFARVDGFAVFVDQAVPQDVVKACVVKKKKNYAEARIVEMIAPSPLRIEAPCTYSGNCGGCRWQHLPYDLQLEYKRRHVKEALEHIGNIRDVRINSPLPSLMIFGYRNKMEFSCSDRKWLLPEQMDGETIDIGFAIGLHVPGTFYKVLDIQACMLQPETGNGILDDVRCFIKNSDLPVYGLKSHEGFWRFLMLRHSVSKDEWMVNIITASENRKTVNCLSKLLMDKYSNVVSVVNNITSRKAAIAVGEYEIQLGGEPCIKDVIGPYTFEISANSFFQTNTGAAKGLYDTVVRYACLTGNETVLDLYSGTGTIPIYLSQKAARVVGMEIVESAVSDAQKNCRLNHIDNCHFIQGDIRTSLPNIDFRPDVMIIDPPRDGMHKDVVKQVLDMAPEKIVYVSCNPATLARDLALMKDSYNVIEVQPVDMFPHTFHIESVACLGKIT